MMKVMNNYTFEDLLDLVQADTQNEGSGGEITYKWTDAEKIMSLLSDAIRPADYSPSQYERDEFTFILNALDIDFKDYMSYYVKYSSYPTIEKRFYNVTPYTKLFKLIKLRFGDHYAVTTKDVLSSSTNQYGAVTFNGNKEIKDFASKFFGILLSTKDKYIAILRAYTNNLNNLMSPLKSKVTAKNLFNDTPQTTDVTATIEANQYVTNLSKNYAESESDNAYVIEKLKKIQDDYENTLYRWSDEFHSLFIEEDMI